LKLTLEFTGLAREIAKTRQTEIEVPDGSTYQQVMARAAARFPKLVGLLFHTDDGTLLNSIVVARNGGEMILPDAMDERPEDGDHLTLVGIIVGG
jgi:molybdopterin converting factor small subunit